MDARHIGQILLSHPELPALSVPSWLRSLKELVRTRLVLARELKAHRMRLQKMQEPLVRESLERVIEALKEEATRPEREIARQGRELAPSLLEVTGIGPVVAGVVLTEVGDIRRFKGEDAFASYCGAAPIFWQSGASSVVRVNPGGNRRINWALHIIALARIRVDPTTRAFFQRKVA